MGVALEDFDALLNATTLDLLGDTITYTPEGAALLTFKAIADQGQMVERLSGSMVIQGEQAVEVPRTLVATVKKGDLITLPAHPGKQFNPKSWVRDESGANWLIVLARKAA